MSECLPVNVSECMPVYLSQCLPFYVSECLPVYVSECLPVYLSYAGCRFIILLALCSSILVVGCPSSSQPIHLQLKASADFVSSYLNSSTISVSSLCIWIYTTMLQLNMNIWYYIILYCTSLLKMMCVLKTDITWHDNVTQLPSPSSYFSSYLSTCPNLSLSLSSLLLQLFLQHIRTFDEYTRNWNTRIQSQSNDNCTYVLYYDLWFECCWCWCCCLLLILLSSYDWCWYDWHDTEHFLFFVRFEHEFLCSQ